MKNVNKYERQYFMPPVCEYDWAKKDHIEKRSEERLSGVPLICVMEIRR